MSKTIDCPIGPMVKFHVRSIYVFVARESTNYNNSYTSSCLRKPKGSVMVGKLTYSAHILLLKSNMFVTI